MRMVALCRSSVIGQICSENIQIIDPAADIHRSGILPDPATDGGIEYAMIDSLSAPHLPATASPVSPRADDLDADVQESLNYQILQRTLRIEEPASPGEAARDIREAHEAREPLAAARSAASFSQTLSEQRSLEVNLNAAPAPQQVDPLVLDIAGNGFSTSGLSRAVRFDLDGDGRQDWISVPTGDDALLALDRNGNKRIDDGRELFGDQHGAANGFAELARFDDNGDGRIDAADAVFDQLRLLRFDALGRQHLQRLDEAGVSAIHLQARDVSIALGAYDEIAQLGRFDFADGRSGQAADLLLAKR